MDDDSRAPVWYGCKGMQRSGFPRHEWYGKRNEIDFQVADMLKAEIRIKGKIDEHWSAWFEGFEISYQGEDESVLTGTVRDQSELYGLLSRMRDLGLGLLSVETQDVSGDDPPSHK